MLTSFRRLIGIAQIKGRPQIYLTHLIIDAKELQLSNNMLHWNEMCCVDLDPDIDQIAYRILVT